MSRDIRSYFNIGGAKKAPAPIQNESPAPIKRKALITSSDEEEVPITPKEKHNKAASKKRRISDSDDESAKQKTSKKPNLTKLKESPQKKKDVKKAVDVTAMFGDEPKRVERKKPKKESVPSEDCLMPSDDEFEKSIANLEDIDKIAKENENGKKSSEKKINNNNDTTPKKENKVKTPKSAKKSLSEVGLLDVPEVQETKTKVKTSKLEQKAEMKTPKSTKKSLSEIGLSDDPEIKSETKEEKKKAKTPKSEKKPEPKAKTPTEHKPNLDSSVLSDEERHERKRLSAVLYQKYKNRQSVINHGCKEVPKGKPNCLAGLSFLVTGILESLEREEANSLIKDLGGKVSTTVGKRLNFMVVGEEAGPKKLVTAEELGIKILTEDGLFDLIREKSSNDNSSESKVSKISPKDKKTEPKTPIKVKEEKAKKSSEKRKIKEESGTVDVKRRNLEMPDATSSNVGMPDDENLAWVDKYKPTSLKQIIGQQGPASNCVKLLNWLSKWHANHDGKKKLQRPNPWAKNDDGSFYKAALLSGPPGVGKTTTATLVCKELGYDMVEFNASDTRSKKLLKEEVSELLSNKSLYGYFHGKKEVSKNHVLIMDEVDGMAGNEDRGGIQELISLIKDSSVPIICMCNDRNHQKMRSLVNYCYDLRFNKPRLEQIKGPIMSICFKEKIKLPPAKVEEIISATNNDIRQTLNHLSLLSAGKDLKLNENQTKTANKDLKLGPWEVVRKVFSADEHKHMTLEDRSDLFFHDYSLGPLFVQQNYLMVSPKVPKSQVPQQVALTADSLSLSDLIEKRIRSDSAWSLLPVQAMFSSVMPGEYMSGHFTGQINFPGWLGKNSKSSKRSRLAQEIHDHTRVCTSGSRLSVRLDFAPFLLNAIVRPLREKGLEGVQDALNVMKEYRLLREDLDSLIELTTWPGKKNPMDSVDSKVKAALTRSYNKEVLAYSYSAMANVKKKKAEAMDEEMEMLEEGEGDEAQVLDDDEEEEKLENDALIKAKKKPATKAGSSTSKAESKKASSSKPKASRAKK